MDLKDAKLGDIIVGDDGTPQQVIRVEGDEKTLAALTSGTCDAFCDRVRSRGFSHCRHGKP